MTSYSIIISNLKDSFYNEIQIAARLDHFNLLRIVEVYKGTGTFYLIMEYLEGRSLGEVLRNARGTKLPEKEIKLVMRVFPMNLIYKNKISNSYRQ
jgi:serine/threonine protein kinase